MVLPENFFLRSRSQKEPNGKSDAVAEVLMTECPFMCGDSTVLYKRGGQHIFLSLRFSYQVTKLAQDLESCCSYWRKRERMKARTSALSLENAPIAKILQPQKCLLNLF